MTEDNSLSIPVKTKTKKKGIGFYLTMLAIGVVVLALVMGGVQQLGGNSIQPTVVPIVTSTALVLKTTPFNTPVAPLPTRAVGGQLLPLATPLLIVPPLYPTLRRPEFVPSPISSTRISSTAVSSDSVATVPPLTIMATLTASGLITTDQANFQQNNNAWLTLGLGVNQDSKWEAHGDELWVMGDSAGENGNGETVAKLNGWQTNSRRFTFQAEVYSASGETAGILLGDSSGLYICHVNGLAGDSMSLNLERFSNSGNQSVELPANNAGHFEPTLARQKMIGNWTGQWHTFKLAYDGNNLLCAVDDQTLNYPQAALQNPVNFFGFYSTVTQDTRFRKAALAQDLSTSR